MYLAHHVSPHVVPVRLGLLVAPAVLRARVCSCGATPQRRAAPADRDRAALLHSWTRDGLGSGNLHRVDPCKPLTALSMREGACVCKNLRAILEALIIPREPSRWLANKGKVLKLRGNRLALAA